MKTIVTSVSNNISRTQEVTMFLNDARKYPTRSAKEQAELAVKAQNGNLNARRELIQCNLMFIFSVCSKYANGNDILDLISVATIGMDNSIDLFDAEKGVTFLSYAVKGMQDEIMQYLNKDNSLIVNKAASKLYTKVAKVRERFFQENERYPMASEIVSELAMQGIDANEYQVASLSFDSFSDVIGDEDATREECGEIAVATSSICEYEKDVENESLHNNMEKCLSCLSNTERKVIEMSFGLKAEFEMCDDDIAAYFGMTQQRISQIKRDALAKMQAYGKRLAIGY